MTTTVDPSYCMHVVNRNMHRPSHQAWSNTSELSKSEFRELYINMNS